MDDPEARQGLMREKMAPKKKASVLLLDSAGAPQEDESTEPDVRRLAPAHTHGAARERHRHAIAFAVAVGLRPTKSHRRVGSRENFALTSVPNGDRPWAHRSRHGRCRRPSWS